MRAELATAVREAFEHRLQQELPGFAPVANDELPRECHLYACTKGGVVTFYVMLQFRTHEDSFTIELAWGRPGRYPMFPAFMVGRVNVEEASRRREGRLRLGSLWTDRDVWWDVGPGRYSRFLRHVLGHSQAARIETQVEDAWRRLTKEGVTCLEAVALRLGIDL